MRWKQIPNWLKGGVIGICSALLIMFLTFLMRTEALQTSWGNWIIIFLLFLAIGSFFGWLSTVASASRKGKFIIGVFVGALFTLIEVIITVHAFTLGMTFVFFSSTIAIFWVTGFVYWIIEEIKVLQGPKMNAHFPQARPWHSYPYWIRGGYIAAFISVLVSAYFFREIEFFAGAIASFNYTSYIFSYPAIPFYLFLEQFGPFPALLSFFIFMFSVALNIVFYFCVGALIGYALDQYVLKNPNKQKNY